MKGRKIKAGEMCHHRELIEQRSVECYNCTFNHLANEGGSVVPRCMFDFIRLRDPQRVKRARGLWELRRHVEGVNYDAGRRFYDKNY